ncbi:MAG: GDP-mannose 4,6-dehydratase, partial [Alphaproteobacteria bacterium]|nr:GDP-mannose 4,6-dehydratase [Alphaproteobacteria bacterium]
MTVLVTGVAGFIGYHVANALLDAGEQVLGVDNMSSYYNPRLKEARVNTLSAYPDFTFLKLDLSAQESLEALRAQSAGVTRVIHLAAQPGIRYSLKDPYAYVQANVAGHLTVLELCRGLAGGLKHLVFASSSSVYGGNETLP